MDTPTELAVRAARAGGDVIEAAFGRPVVGKTKGVGDYVSDVDRAAEDAIREVLGSGAPDIPLLAEETGGRLTDPSWVVDPLDGTTNFLHGFPVVAVSVALVEAGRPTVGVVHAPLLGATYVGARGEGATLRRPDRGPQPLRVSARGPGAAVVGTGFPFRSRGVVPRYLRMFEACFERFEDLRRPGAAALDLAWAAAGVFDGFFELNLSPWDVAAGALLVEEAGGTVSDWDGGDGWLGTGNILAGNPGVHAALAEMAATG